MNACVSSDFDIRAVDRSALVDIRDVKVNTALPKRERILDFIRQIGNGDPAPRIMYSVKLLVLTIQQPMTAGVGRTSIGRISGA